VDDLTVIQHASFNISEINIEWENYKKSNSDLQENVPSTIHLKNISSDSKISSTTSEAVQADQLILNALRLFSMASIHVDTSTFGKNIMGPLPSKLNANVKAELLQSDNNQIAIPEETVNYIIFQKLSKIVVWYQTWFLP